MNKSLEKIGLNQLVELGAAKPLMLKKAVQAVHMGVIGGSQTRIQRLLWNAMLKHAHEVGEGDGDYSIPRKKLMDMVEYDSKNLGHFKGTLRKMQDLKVEWDILTADGDKDWLSCALLITVGLKGEDVIYQFHPAIRHPLFDAKVYAHIDLRIQRQFRLDGAAALYEWCIRFRKLNMTCVLAWEKWRWAIAGEVGEDSVLKEYKYFKKKKLVPAINEINEKSDILIELREIKQGKWVRELQFQVREKPMFLPSEEHTRKTNKWQGRLEELGMLERAALDVIGKYPDNVLEAHYQYTLRRMNDKSQAPIKKPGSYFTNALEHGRAMDMVKPEGPAVPQNTSERANEVISKLSEHRTREARGYFNELSAEEQRRTVEEFNLTLGGNASGALDPAALPAFRHMLPFYQWLADHTWGAPSSADVLEFAMKQGALAFGEPA